MGIRNVSEVQNRSSYGKVGSSFISFAPDDSKINRWFIINILSTRKRWCIYNILQIDDKIRRYITFHHNLLISIICKQLPLFSLPRIPPSLNLTTSKARLQFIIYWAWEPGARNIMSDPQQNLVLYASKVESNPICQSNGKVTMLENVCSRRKKRKKY